MSKKQIRISDDLALPLDWITLATVVYGARGSGKTSLGRVFAEESMKARQRFCAIDLKGDWWGLKSSADGKQDGLPVVVFGGDHQDVPLEEGAGKFVGETVAKIEQSCILDLEYFSKGKQVRFLTEFFLSLYDANREPLLLLLDEAQRYAPQSRMPDPDSAKCLGAVEDLVKLGRKHGIGPVLFTQRGSGLNKEVSELCDLLVAFRTPGPLDQDRVKDWLDANTTKTQRDQVMGQLSGLATGTAVFASGHPDLKVFGVHAVRRPETFDSSATPKVGQRRLEPKKLAKPDLDGLREKMAAAIERAKADDPKALRAKIAGLEADLVKARKSGAAVASVVPKPGKTIKTTETIRIETAIEIPDQQAIDVLKTSLHVELKKLKTDLAEHVAHVERTVSAFQISVNEQRAAFKRRKPLVTRETSDGAASVPAATAAAAASSPRPQTDPPVRAGDEPGDPALGNSGLRRMLIALAQRPSGITNRQIGARAGLASGSGTFKTYLSKARQSGWVENQGTKRLITAAGVEALGSFEPLPTGQALLEYWLGEMGQSGAARILRVLVDAYPATLSNQEIAERAEFADAVSGTFKTYMSKLRTLELIDGERGATQASAEFFE